MNSQDLRCGTSSALVTILLLSLAANAGVQVIAASDAELQRGASSEQVSKASMDELTIRRNILTKILPTYPPGAAKRRVQGTVVASILISSKGTVALAQVLQSPDREITESVLGAVRGWVFRPVSAGPEGKRHAIDVETKLTFFFQIGPSGDGIVKEPSSGSDSGLSAQPRGSLVEVSETQWKEWQRVHRPVVIDIRPRTEFAAQHRPGTMNIPGDELNVRGAELSPNKAVAIDCTEDLLSFCRFSSRILLNQGFKTVAILMRR